MADVEVNVNRLVASVTMAIAKVSGIVEHHARMGRRDMPDPLAAIREALAAVPEDARPTVLAHAGATYVDPEYAYQSAALELLRQAGMNLVEAREVAVFRAGQPGGMPPEAARRRALLGENPVR